MVIDTSALVAILEQEDEADEFSKTIAAAGTCLASAATVVEIGMVHGEPGGRKVDELLLDSDVEVVPVTEDHARLAREGFARFGKGRHPARLNFGSTSIPGCLHSAGESIVCSATEAARGGGRGLVPSLVFKTSCRAVIPSWAGSIPVRLRLDSGIRSLGGRSCR